MFDTLYIWLPSERAGEIDLNQFTKYLLDVEDCFQNGERKIRGRLRNLKVLISPTGISIKGSLPKFHYGNNLKNLTSNEIKSAIQKIGNDLSIPILKARLTRIDIGINLSMDHEPKYYFRGLGKLAKMARGNFSETSLYYTNTTKTLNFYDKNREFYKTSKIPDKFGLEKNLLRYELRLKKWLGRNFENREVLVSNLIDKKFCKQILAIWAENYFSIKKNNIVHFDPTLIHLPKDYLEFLTLKGIEAHRENISTDIKFLKSIESLKSKEYYSRLIAKINEISSSPKITIESDLNKELDFKITQILAEMDSG